MRKKLSALLFIALAAIILLPAPLSAQADHTTKVNIDLLKKESRKQKKAVERLTSLLPQKSIQKAQDFQSVKPTPGLTLPSPLRAPALMTAGDGTVIYGSVIYADNWTEQNAPMGIYSFPATDNLALTEVAINDGLSVNGGGVFVEGKYHFTEYISFLGIMIVTYHTFDTETWTEEGEGISVDITSIASDLTYDPVTQNIYGSFFNENGNGYVFGKLDRTTGISTKIGDLPQILLAVACNSEGNIYGIGGDGNLYAVNKTTGELSLVGPTGVSPKYTQSGTFDLKTDKFYWAACLADETSALYEVNPATGTATLISALPNNEEITGVYIPAPAAEDGAPAIVKNLTAAYDGGSTTGNVRFTMPTETFAGAPLSGSLGYKVLFNSEEMATGTASPGEALDLTIDVPAAGMYTITAISSNTVGNSPSATIEKWIGNDAPRAVTGLMLEKGTPEGKMTLSWTAPTEGYPDIRLPPRSTP